MKPLYFKIKKSADDQFYFTMETNGNVITTSETYTEKHNAEKVIDSIVRIILAGKVETIDTTKKQF